MQIRVPIDRTTTRFMLYSVHAPVGIDYPEQLTVPDYNIPVFWDNGRHRTDYVEGQDIMAWVTQGRITDRTVEHLGRSDVGVTMLRRMFKAEMAKVAAGADPLGVIRERHDRIDLPCEKNKFDAGPAFAIDFIDKASMRFSPQADALKKLHLEAWENRERAAS
jgi:5,5'-dehydrodivanillate O-demethylase oxygenase subunit